MGNYISTFTMLPFGKTTLRMNYEGCGVYTSDNGKGIFHNQVQHVLGGMNIVNGIITDSGFIIGTLTTGDKVFMTYECSGKIGEPVKGTFTYVAGTGAIKGITGGGEFTRTSLPHPVAEGKRASFSKTKANWKLPDKK